MGAVLGNDRWYSIDTSNRVSDSFCISMNIAALLLKSVEYDRCWRRTARARVGCRATNLAAHRKPGARRCQTYVRHSEYASHGFRSIQLQGRSGCIDRVRLW